MSRCCLSSKLLSSFMIVKHNVKRLMCVSNECRLHASRIPPFFFSSFLIVECTYPYYPVLENKTVKKKPYQRYQRMHQVPIPKNVPGTGTKECTRYRYQRIYQVPVSKNVPGTGTKESTRYRYQRMYQVPVPNNAPGTGTKECTRYRCVRSNVADSTL